MTLATTELTTRPTPYVPNPVHALNSVLRLAFMSLLALFVVVAAPITSGHSQAEAGLLKKVKTGAKFAGKGFKKMERAGRKMSRKKGIVGKIGKGMRKVGRGGRMASGGVRKGISKGQRAVGRQLGKSKLGRGVMKANKGYKKLRRNGLNKAFKRCNAQWCEDAKDGIDAVVPG
ncbi:MAG: hypothetical protein AAFO98_02620 [Pseudomonadota bacterium]